MKTNRIYKITNIQAGALGFGNGNVGQVLRKQKHSKNNHGLLESDYGIYVQKSTGEIWKLEANFEKATLREKATYYLEKTQRKISEIKNFIKRF